MKSEREIRDYAATLFEAAVSTLPSEWCQSNLVLPPEESDEPGPLSLAHTPYDVEILDAFADDRVTDLVVVGTPQGGKTLVLLLGLAWSLKHRRKSTLFTLPNVVLFRRMSRRWRTLIEANPILDEMRPADADLYTNTEQELDGATVTFANAMSIANISSSPKAMVLQDEVDKFVQPSHKESHASLQADKRTQKQHNPKRVKTSSPTLPEGVIWQEFLKGDQREWHVPCPGCGEFFQPETNMIRWDSAAKGKSGRWDYGMVERTAHLVPPCCPDRRITEDQRVPMMRAGKWVPTNPAGANPGYRTYRRPLMIMPWRAAAFRSIAVQFLESKRTWNMHDFVNSVEARPYRPEAKSTNAEVLQARAYTFEALIPAPVLCLTASADVQDDRIEVEILGWGLGLENWAIEYGIFRGNPADPALWAEVDAFLLETRALPVAAACVDSGGHHTQAVYNFARRRETRRVFAVRGTPHPGKPIVQRPSRTKEGVLLWSLGTDTAKGLIHSHFRVDKPGPGYCHFRDDLDREYFDQLCAEEMRTRYQRGHAVYEWHKIRERNEALDLRVYNYAAIHILGGIRHLEKLDRRRRAEARMEVAVEAPVATVPAVPAAEKPRRPAAGIRRRSFATNW